MSSHHEIEHTYDPPVGARLPDLTGLPGVTSMDATGTVELEAAYFDTDDLRLAAAGVTLRRRTGGADEGWHLKVPSGGGRDEVHLPLSRARHTPPKPLRQATLAWSRGAALSRVATVRTRRTTYLLHDASGAVLAEAVDDHVDASVELAADGDPTDRVSWREWEVELVEAGTDLLDAADALLADHDAPLASVGRKIARVLGDRMPEPPRPKRPRRGKPAGRVLHHRLVEQVAAFRARDSEVRRDAPDGVHRARVAARRLRSALATFRPLVDRELTDPLRDELRWISRLLGEARDAEVSRDLLGDVLAGSSGPDVLEGPDTPHVRAARGVLDADRRDAYREAHAAAVEAMESDRYLRFLDGLDRLVAAPPWTERAEWPAADVVPRRLRRDLARLRRRMAAALDDSVADHPDERAAALHAARKAAKRLRYAAEAAGPAYGKQAERLARRTKHLQSALGDHHDTVAARAVLRRLADEGDGAFALGHAHARLETAATDHEQRARRAWDRLGRKKVTGWLE